MTTKLENSAAAKVFDNVVGLAIKSGTTTVLSMFSQIEERTVGAAGSRHMGGNVATSASINFPKKRQNK